MYKKLKKKITVQNLHSQKTNQQGQTKNLTVPWYPKTFMKLKIQSF